MGAGKRDDDGFMNVARSARFQLAVIAAVFFVIIFTLDRTVVDPYRRPVSQGGKNLYLSSGAPAQCFDDALTKFMNSRVHDGYSCARALPPWGYWGQPPATCKTLGSTPPGCSSKGIQHVPCPYDLPATGPPVKTSDQCGNPLCTQVFNETTGVNQTECAAPAFCIPDCIANLAAECQADIAPYSGPPYECLKDTTLTSAQAGANIFLYVVQSLYTAFGTGFFIVYGSRIRNVKNPFLKTRAIATWLAISYYFISWYPHAELHELYSGGDSWGLVILTETLFHWPMSFASGVLCYYQIDLLMIFYEVSVLKKNYATYVKDNNIRWWRNYKVQAVIATLLGYGFWLGLVYGLSPIPTGADPGLDKWDRGIWNRCWPTAWEQFFLYSFWLVDSFVGGTGFGFLVISLMVTRVLEDKTHKKVSIGSSICIFYNLTLSGFHTMVHTVVPPCVSNIITIDYAIHLTLIASVCVLAYFQFLVLDAQADPKSALQRGYSTRQKQASGTTNSSSNLNNSSSNNSSNNDSSNNSSSLSVAVDDSVEMNQV